MGKYLLKPGIIHIDKDAISPFTHTGTVILDKNTKLELYLDQLYEKYHNRNKPTWQYFKFSVSPNDWKMSDNIYKASVGKLQGENYRLYHIITNLGLDIPSNIALASDILYKFIQLELIEDELFLLCNIQPSSNISGNIIITWIYNVEMETTTPKNLEIQLQKEQFIKAGDMDYAYKLKIPELDNTINYHVSCTFDLDNILKYVASNNRYIVAEYSYGEVNIYTEFPFTAKVILIFHRI